VAGLGLEGENFAEALRMLKPVLESGDVPLEALALGGAVYAQIRLFERSEKLYQKYLEKRPRASVERFQLGVVQAQIGKLAEALGAWEEVLKGEPNFFPALLYKGMALIQRNRIAEAKQALDAVLRLAPAGSPHFAQAREWLQVLEGGRVPEAEVKNVANPVSNDTRPVVPQAYRSAG